MPEQYTGHKSTSTVAGFGNISDYIMQACASHSSAYEKGGGTRGKRNGPKHIACVAALHKFGCYTVIGNVQRPLDPSEIAVKIGDIRRALCDGFRIDDRQYSFFAATQSYMARPGVARRGKPIKISWEAVKNINAIHRQIREWKATNKVDVTHDPA